MRTRAVRLYCARDIRLEEFDLGPVALHPTIIGGEFCGVVDEAGKNWARKFKKGNGFVIQPAHSYQGVLTTPGYSFRECDGDATYVNIP